MTIRSWTLFVGMDGQTGVEGPDIEAHTEMVETAPVVEALTELIDGMDPDSWTYEAEARVRTLLSELGGEDTG